MYLCDGSGGATYTGTNTDGSGVYVSTDRVTHPYKFPLIRKCWYEYFVTNASLYNTGWRKSSGDTFCSGTSTCTVGILTGTETCQSRTTEVSLEVGLEIPNTPVEFGLNYKTSVTKEGCYSASDTTACEWNDGQCHTVFTSQQLVKQVGYRRQRCNWGNGDETECMADLEIDTPTDQTSYQCGAQCGTDEMIVASSSTDWSRPSSTQSGTLKPTPALAQATTSSPKHNKASSLTPSYMNMLCFFLIFMGTTVL